MARRIIVGADDANFGPAQPSIVDRLKGAAKYAGTMVNPVGTLAHVVAQPAESKKWASAGLEGLRGNPSAPGASGGEEAANFAGRYGPATMAAMAAGPAAVGAKAAAKVVGKLGQGVISRGLAGLTSLGTRAAVGGAAGGAGSLAGSTVAGDPNLDAALEVGEEFGKGEIFGAGVEKAAPPVWRGLKAVGEGVLRRSSGVFSGTPAAAWETLKQSGERVRQLAKSGWDLTPENKPIPKAGTRALALGEQAKEAGKAARAEGMARAGEIGVSAQERVGAAARGEGKKFEKMMEHLANDDSATRFKMAEAVYDRFEPYLKSQGASLRRPVGEAETSAAKRIKDIYDEVRNSGVDRVGEGVGPGVSPQQAAEWLQELTAIQRNNPGKTSSAHARALKDALLDSMPGDYTHSVVDSMSPTPKWNIRETRAEYAAGKQLERETGAFTRSENPVQAFERLTKAGGKTSRGLNKALTRVEGFSDDVAKMRAAAADAEKAGEAAAASFQPEINVSEAGAAFAPWVGNLPRTGLTGALLTKTGLNPMALPLLLGASPRLSMETYLLGRKAAPAVEGAAAKAAPHVPRAVAAVLEAMRKKRKEEKK